MLLMVMQEEIENTRHLRQVRRLQQQSHGHQGGHHDHQQAERGVQLGDDLVDGQQGGEEVVAQDHQYPEGVATQNGALEKRQVTQQPGRAHDEHHADEEQQHGGEYQHAALEHHVVIVAGDFRQALAILLQAHDTGEVIMHRAADHVAEHDPDERDRAIQRPQDGAEDGADTRNVQELDQEGFEGADRNVVDAVAQAFLRGYGRGIYARLFFNEGAVELVAEKKYRKADEEKQHGASSSLFFKVLWNHLKAPAAPPGLKAQGTLVEAQEPMAAAVQVPVVRFTQEDSTPATTRCETPGASKAVQPGAAHMTSNSGDGPGRQPGAAGKAAIRRP